MSQLEEFKVDQEGVFKLLTDEVESAAAIEETTKAKEERKLQPLPESNNDFYAEEDSDNDSDFEVKYAQPEDTFQDLIPIKKPLYLSDLI